MRRSPHNRCLQQGASAEAGADAEPPDEGTDADWQVLASAVALPSRAVPAPPARVVEAPVAEASGETPGVEQRMWAAAMAARRAAAQPTAAAEDIIGPDNRIRVTDTNVAPWRVPADAAAGPAAVQPLLATAHCSADVPHCERLTPY